jgi:hypothetical protein
MTDDFPKLTGDDIGSMPAYPDSSTTMWPGINKREFIAAQVLHGMLAACFKGSYSDVGRRVVSREAIAMTDQLLADLAEKANEITEDVLAREKA